MSSSPSRDTADPSMAFRDLAEVEFWAKDTEVSGHPRSYVSTGSLEGPVFDVGTSTRSGMHQVVGIRALPTDGHTQATPPTEPECAVLRSVVRAVLDLVGHETGSARTQVVLTTRGPQIARLQLDDVPQDLVE
ncbi:hypothetical protein AQI84_15730 [Streptomyces griseorubiginosus]|uniref:Uncharacterized protein n=2 Tax=Streptomyces griseorubiginosus TaxID=67304 RepID=A0AAI8L2J7_9ACTN|nr:hypothetical protein DWG14_06030 [Streptomyces griseorubiginosus]KUM76855.1 hypothetical protein AQI84_15730 [Streptomyces griseorubiginosus]